MEQLRQRPINTKFIIMVLLGEYIRPHGGQIWLGDLLHLLDLLGVGERTARSTMTRMAKEGWFEIKKQGRQSQYKITPFGLSVLHGGDLRLDESILTDWDKSWQMIAYSLPENRRKLRNDLRKQLYWLGYGRLATGLWISPHKRPHEIDQMVKTMELTPFVHLFSGVYQGPLTHQQLIATCWDLTSLNARYQQFINAYKPLYQTIDPQTITPEQAFQYRFWLTVNLFPILQKDPNLPITLLPNDWGGIEGRSLFKKFRQIVTPDTIAFIKQIIQGSRTVGPTGFPLNKQPVQQTKPNGSPQLLSTT